MTHINSSETNSQQRKESILDASYLQLTLLNSPGLVAIVRLSDLNVLFVNAQFEHYLEYNNSDIAGAPLLFTELLEPYHYDRFEQQLSNIQDNITSRAKYLIYPLKSKTGRLGNYYLYGSPIDQEHADHGKLVYLLMFPDLSKWGMPFTSFDSKELFLEQFESEDFGTFERNLDVDKVFWSHGIYRIFEVGDEVSEIGTHFAMSFIHPGDRERVKEITAQSLTDDSDINLELKIVTAKGNVKTIHCLARVVKNIYNKPMLLTGSVRDITKQREIEQSLKDKVEELNHTNRELAEFAYVASHDLQEPLRKITTFSDRLAEKYKDVLTGEGAMYLSRMMASAENMRKLINDLLEFSRVSKTVLPFEPVDLNIIIKQVTAELELIIEETGTSLKTDKLPTIQAVSTQMKQLFANIINNAIKFHREGVNPSITVEAVKLSEQEKRQYELSSDSIYYKIQVTDNGIGFENEYSARIFQVFQRLHGKSEYPGSGIGLAICKKIIEYHHGIIYAENIPDVGARFTFIVPKEQPATKQENI